MEIRNLVDVPKVVPTLAEAFAEEWPDYAREVGREAIVERFRECLRRDALPLTLVALEGPEVVGTVGLRWDSIRSRPALGPWLAAFYVVPRLRGRGVGAHLAREAERAARTLGLAELYAGTSTARTLFERLGWRRHEDLDYAGEPLTIYHKVMR